MTHLVCCGDRRTCKAAQCLLLSHVPHVPAFTSLHSGFLDFEWAVRCTICAQHTAKMWHCIKRTQKLRPAVAPHTAQLAYPGLSVGCAGFADCRPSRAKGRVCILLSLVVNNKKGPPGPCPLTATEVTAPWRGVLPQYSWPPSDSPTAGAVLGPACTMCCNAFRRYFTWHFKLQK